MQVFEREDKEKHCMHLKMQREFGCIECNFLSWILNKKCHVTCKRGPPFYFPSKRLLPSSPLTTPECKFQSQRGKKLPKKKANKDKYQRQKSKTQKLKPKEEETGTKGKKNLIHYKGREMKGRGKTSQVKWRKKSEWSNNDGWEADTVTTNIDTESSGEIGHHTTKQWQKVVSHCKGACLSEPNTNDIQSILEVINFI